MIQEKIQSLRNSIPDTVRLVAVSKTKPVESILEAYQTGQRIFGENKVQELVDKAAVLPSDIEWHLIGHLQTNKVKYIAPFVAMIHAVDSFKLLKEIDKEAKKNQRVISCLLQFHIAEEENKFGFSLEEVKEILASDEFLQLDSIKIVGVMGMATFTENEDQVAAEFRELASIFQILKSHFFKFNPDFVEISMGMSGDYQIAIEEGSTLIRVGSSIFGGR